MKKHTFQEHFESVREGTIIWNKEGTLGTYLKDQMITFLAYERWLNDRELFTEENVKK